MLINKWHKHDNLTDDDVNKQALRYETKVDECKTKY